MPNIKTIRTASHSLGVGDFTSIQAWEDYADGESDPAQWAECYSGGNLGLFELSGWSSTPSSSGYPKIYAASGEGHGGNPRRGPHISVGTTSEVNTIGVNYSVVEGLTSNRGFHMDLSTSHFMRVQNCIASCSGAPSFKAKTELSNISSSGNAFYNCLSIGSPTIPSGIGFEVGGEDMVQGKPRVDCINCTAYGHSTVGFKSFGTKIAGTGYFGGSDVTLRNFISMGNTGADIAYSIGPYATFFNSNGITSDVSSSGTASLFPGATGDKENLYSQTPASVFVNPTTTITEESGIMGDFRLKSTSPAIGHGLDYGGNAFESGFLSRDIAGVRREADYWSSGAYQYDPQTPSGLFNLFLKGSGLDTVTNNFSLWTFAPIPEYMNLYTNGLIPSGIGVSLHTTNFLTTKSATLFAEGSEQLFYPQFTPGASGQWSDGSPSILGRPSLSSQSTQYIIPMFIGTHPDRNISTTNTLNITGQSDLYPKAFKYNRRLTVESKGFFPGNGTATMFIHPEDECSELKARYLFNYNTQDSENSFDVNAVTGTTSLYASKITVNYGTANPITWEAVEQPASALFSGISSYERSHDDIYSSSGGIAISFWIYKVGLPSLAPPLNNPDVEGIITKGFTSWNATSSVLNVGGDWGIFKNTVTSEQIKENLLFYTNVLDNDRHRTVINEGVYIDNFKWYLVMFWIDEKHKSSYVRIREQGDYVERNTLKTYNLQRWDTSLMSRENPNITDQHKFNVGYNSALGTNLGSKYGDGFALDDIRIYKPKHLNICSKVAMEQKFDEIYASYIISHFSTSSALGGGGGGVDASRQQPLSPEALSFFINGVRL